MGIFLKNAKNIFETLFPVALSLDYNLKLLRYFIENLNQHVLNPACISSIVEQSPHVITQNVILPKTFWESIDTLQKLLSYKNNLPIDANCTIGFEINTILDVGQNEV